MLLIIILQIQEDLGGDNGFKHLLFLRIERSMILWEFSVDYSSPEISLKTVTTVHHTHTFSAEAIAQLPLHLYKYNDSRKERVPRHPLYFLLHDQPNPEMTSFVFRETLMSHLLIYGNAYAQIIRNGRGDVLGLYPLMPDKIKVDRDEKNHLIYIYSHYNEANPNLKEQGDIILYADEVLHIPSLDFDGLVGYSSIALAKNAIGISIACEEYGASFFGNGASPSGVFEHPGIIKNPKHVRDAWQRAHGGRNVHNVAVLEEGMKFTPIAIPNN